MAKNKKNTYKKEVEEKKAPKRMTNPAGMTWGKIIIAFLAIAMCLSGLVTVIALIIQNA